MRIHFLGTASGLPTASRFSQTIVVSLEDGLHILDAADGASSLICRHGLDHRAVRSIVISHMHGDHHSGLIQLIKTMMHHGRKDPLLIYLPEEGIAAYRQMLEACYLIDEWLGFPVQWRPIRADERLQLSPRLAIRAFPNDHLQPFKVRAQSVKRVPSSWRYESYSFVIYSETLTLAYSGNLRKSLLEMKPYASNVDVLICELAHLDPTETRAALLALRPRLAIFAHFHPRWDEGRLDVLQDPIPGIDVHLAQDGDVYDIPSLLTRSTQDN